MTPALRQVGPTTYEVYSAAEPSSKKPPDSPIPETDLSHAQARQQPEAAEVTALIETTVETADSKTTEHGNRGLTTHEIMPAQMQSIYTQCKLLYTTVVPARVEQTKSAQKAYMDKLEASRRERAEVLVKPLGHKALAERAVQDWFPTDGFDFDCAETEKYFAKFQINVAVQNIATITAAQEECRRKTDETNQIAQQYATEWEQIGLAMESWANVVHGANQAFDTLEEVVSVTEAVRKQIEEGEKKWRDEDLHTRQKVTLPAEIAACQARLAYYEQLQQASFADQDAQSRLLSYYGSQEGGAASYAEYDRGMILRSEDEIQAIKDMVKRHLALQNKYQPLPALITQKQAELAAAQQTELSQRIDAYALMAKRVYENQVLLDEYTQFADKPVQATESEIAHQHVDVPSQSPYEDEGIVYVVDTTKNPRALLSPAGPVPKLLGRVAAWFMPTNEITMTPIEATTQA
ncbi:hypothetical protein KDA06_00410 [Candidatus Saccharibacteria bacterium]|jgi:hypothetical protein|nr:hypothetical protein [Candidatus Saccharibacteria bacterium]